MNARFTSFRRSKKVLRMNQMIVTIEGVDTKEKAVPFVGKEVIWTSPAGKELRGRIAAVHGRKGAVRSIFETGLPGQSLGTSVTIR